MPYIIKDNRDYFDNILEPLFMCFRNAFITDGEMNYIITKILHKWTENFVESYSVYNKMIGVLECVKQELYRRKLAPYEDKKIDENGDI